MSPDRPPLGNVIDMLGIGHATVSGDTVVGAVVLLKVMDGDGCVSLSAEWSPELSWLERIGMLREAEQVERSRRHGL